MPPRPVRGTGSGAAPGSLWSFGSGGSGGSWGPALPDEPSAVRERGVRRAGGPVPLLAPGVQPAPKREGSCGRRGLAALPSARGFGRGGSAGEASRAGGGRLAAGGWRRAEGRAGAEGKGSGIRGAGPEVGKGPYGQGVRGRGEGPRTRGFSGRGWKAAGEGLGVGFGSGGPHLPAGLAIRSVGTRQRAWQSCASAGPAPPLGAGTHQKGALGFLMFSFLRLNGPAGA